MDVAKLIVVSIVLPDEVVRFQASNPRWEPRRAFVCVKRRAWEWGVFGWLAGCARWRGMGSYDHGSYVERAIVIRSCAYRFERLSP